jgi:hypothetical protein
MHLPTVITLSDVPGAPNVQLVLPGPLRIGDRMKLAFKLRRMNGGRAEQLDASGEWRVTSMTLDATGPLPRQILQVESASPKVPAWKAVKKQLAWERRLAPARNPRTVVA